MTTARVSTPTTGAPQARAHAWEPSDSSYTLKTTQDRFGDSLAKDLNAGRLSPGVHQMADAVRWPGKDKTLQVQVKTFAVDGIQARDIIFIQRVPPTAEGPNIVLFIPEKTGDSFQSFNTLEQMNTWLKTLAQDPKRLDTFSQHFAEGATPARTARVIDTMTRFKNNDINAVVGPYATENSDIFRRLDTGIGAPPASVNGLTDVKEERLSADGRVLYSGKRANAQTVLFEYDAYGNLLGQDNKKQFYFVKNGLNTHAPLVPMTASEFKHIVQKEAADRVGANEIRGFYEELLTHLEHPFSGIGEALQVFGVNKHTADTVERYFDNPVSALLLDLNKDNRIGKVFGIDKATMDAVLSGVGDIAQGFVPVYGQARGLAALLAKVIRNEPLSDQEKTDLADGLALKPDSPARKHLPARKALRAPAGKLSEPKAAAPAKPPAHAPAAPAEPAPAVANRLRPSQAHAIGQFALPQGEQLLAGVKPNAKGLYQIKNAAGEDQWLIRLTDDKNTSQVFKIDGRFKLSDGYVQIVDPHTAKPVLTVHSTGDGGWAPVSGPGGVKWPWQSQGAAPRAFDPGTYDYPAEGEPSTSKSAEKLDKQLKKDADDFHKKAKTKTPPAHAKIPANASPAEVIDTVYQKSPGLIVGEDHSQSAGLRFLIDNAGEFKKNGVTVLYSEGFEHALQADLDRFFETGEFSPALTNNLKLIDRPHSGHGAYTNRELLITMRKQGIRVKAIDVPSTEPKTTRLKNMNYYATRVIDADQAAAPQAKWVARVGSEHVFTYDGEPPVRGLSQLTGATGISVDDAAPNKATSVIQSRDKTELYMDLKKP